MQIICWSCGVEKDSSFFHKHSKSKTGHQSRCKECDKKWHAERYLRDKEKIRVQTKKWRSSNKERIDKKSSEWKAANPEKVKKYQRASNLRKNFGVEISEYDSMFLSQNGKCAICGKNEEFIHHRTGKPAMLAVDHCHKTGKVRGLLCKLCNTALGHFKDDISVLLKAINYLEKHSGK